MLLGPYNLAKEFSKRIENIEISQSYLEFHKKYNEVNNWKDIFNNDKIKNLSFLMKRKLTYSKRKSIRSKTIQIEFHFKTTRDGFVIF